MRLSDIDPGFGIHIERDGEFESLGFVRHLSQRKLVFIESDTYVAFLRENQGVTCVVTTGRLANMVPPNLGLCTADSPRSAFYRLHNFLVRNTDFYWTDRVSTVAP